MRVAPVTAPGARGEAQLVLGPAQPLGLAPGAQGEDPVGVLHDPLAADGRSWMMVTMAWSSNRTGA